MKFGQRTIAQMMSEISLLEIAGGLPHPLSFDDTELRIDTQGAPTIGAILIDRGTKSAEIVDYKVLRPGMLQMTRGRTFPGAATHKQGATAEIIEALTPKEVRAVMLKEYLALSLGGE